MKKKKVCGALISVIAFVHNSLHCLAVGVFFLCVCVLRMYVCVCVCVCVCKWWYKAIFESLRVCV